MHTLDRRTFLTLSAGTMAGLGIPRPDRACAALADARLGDFPSDRAGRTYFTWHELRDGAWAAVDLSLGGNSLILHDSGHSLLIDTKSPALGAPLVREGSGPALDTPPRRRRCPRRCGRALLAQIVVEAGDPEFLADFAA